MYREFHCFEWICLLMKSIYIWDPFHSILNNLMLFDEYWIFTPLWFVLVCRNHIRYFQRCTLWRETKKKKNTEHTVGDCCCWSQNKSSIVMELGVLYFQSRVHICIYLCMRICICLSMCACIFCRLRILNLSS